MAVNSFQNFRFFLEALEHSSKGEKKKFKTALKKLKKIVSDSNIFRFLESKQLFSEKFILYIFRDIFKKNEKLDTKEIELWKNCDKDSFLVPLIKKYRTFRQLDHLLKNLQLFSQLLLHKKKIKFFELVFEMKKTVEEIIYNKEGNLFEAIDGLFKCFPYETTSYGVEINSQFVEFLMCFFTLLENKGFKKVFENMINLSESRFRKHFNRICQSISIERDKIDIVQMNNTRIVFEFFTHLKSIENFELFLQKGLDYLPHFKSNEILDLMKVIRDNFTPILTVLSKNQTDLNKLSAKSESFDQEVRNILKNYYVRFAKNENLNTFDFEIGNKNFTDQIEFEKVVEIKNKVKIFKQTNLIDEKSIDMFRSLENSFKIIFEYKGTLDKCAMKNIQVREVFLKKMKIKTTFVSIEEIKNSENRRLKMSNLEIIKDLEDSSLSVKNYKLNEIIEYFRDFKQRFLKKADFDYQDYYTSFIFEKQYLNLDENKFVNFLRKLDGRILKKKCRNLIKKSKLNELLNKDNKEKKTRGELMKNYQSILQNILEFFKKNRKEFSFNLFGQDQIEEQKKLVDDSLNYIFFGNQNGPCEWTVIQNFYLTLLHGAICPAAKVYYCYPSTTFGDIEPFIYRSTFSEEGLPHLIIGFSNLMSNIQKKVLDLYKRRFEVEKKKAFVVLFLNIKDSANESFINVYKTCFRENVLPVKTKTKKLEQAKINFQKNFDNIRSKSADKINLSLHI